MTVDHVLGFALALAMYATLALIAEVLDWYLTRRGHR
jgi:hypothetical protein